MPSKRGQCLFIPLQSLVIRESNCPIKTLLKAYSLVPKLQEFVAISETIPEAYRVACFTVLLENYLKQLNKAMREGESNNRGRTVESPASFIIPIDVKALLQSHEIDESRLHKIFFLDKSGIRPIYRLQTLVRVDAQVQYAVLVALESALSGGKFEFSMKAVKQRCKDMKNYDKNNFKNNFKNNTRYFNGLKDEDRIELSADGRNLLCDVIQEIAP